MQGVGCQNAFSGFHGEKMRATHVLQIELLISCSFLAICLVLRGGKFDTKHFPQPAEEKVPELGLVDEGDRLDQESKRLERRAAAAVAQPKKLTPEEEAELQRIAKEKREEEQRSEALRLKTEARLAEWKTKKANNGPPIESLEIQTDETFTPSQPEADGEQAIEAVKKRLAATRLANAMK